MPALPLSVWLGIGTLLVVLAALCAGTLFAVLRPTVRKRVAAWPGSRIVLLLVVAAAPWLAVKFLPITIKASIHGFVLPVLWSLAVLCAFALLVLLPIAAVACTLVWGLAWRASRTVGTS
jgi:hypothetical protein